MVEFCLCGPPAIIAVCTGQRGGATLSPFQMVAVEARVVHSVTVSQTRPLSVLFYFVPGKGTDAATLLRLEKYGGN